MQYFSGGIDGDELSEQIAPVELCTSQIGPLDGQD